MLTFQVNEEFNLEKKKQLYSTAFVDAEDD